MSINTIEQMLKYDEGVKNVLYKDSEGYWTIGIGHLITKDKISESAALSLVSKMVGRTVSKEITDQEISMLFQQDLATVKRSIANNAFVKSVYDKLDPIRQMAIENMVFQMGIAGVASFKNTLGAAARGDYQAAYSGCMASKWAKQTPNRANRVAKVLRDGNLTAYN